MKFNVHAALSIFYLFFFVVYSLHTWQRYQSFVQGI